MSDIEKVPTSFQDTVMSIYGQGLNIGRNHTADLIREASEHCVMFGSLSVVKKVKFGLREVEQRAHETFRGTIGEEDVLFGLAVRATGRYNSASQLGNEIKSLPIHLTINDDWEKPAAIILPPKDNDTPTAIVVGNDVNVPEQVEEVRKLLASGSSYYLQNVLGTMSKDL